MRDSMDHSSDRPGMWMCRRSPKNLFHDPNTERERERACKRQGVKHPLPFHALLECVVSWVPETETPKEPILLILYSLATPPLVSFLVSFSNQNPHSRTHTLLLCESCELRRGEREREMSLRVLNPNAEVLNKSAALHMNINAAKGLQDVLKTNLGPKGTIKM